MLSVVNSQEELESAESVKGPISEVVVEEEPGKGLRNKRTGRTFWICQRILSKKDSGKNGNNAKEDNRKRNINKLGSA